MSKPIADCWDRVAQDIDIGSLGVFGSGIWQLSPILSGPCPAKSCQPRIGTDAIVMEAAVLHGTFQEAS